MLFKYICLFFMLWLSLFDSLAGELPLNNPNTCSQEPLKRMIQFLQKEKERILALETRHADAAIQRSGQLKPTDLEYLNSYKQDLKERVSHVKQPLSKGLNRSPGSIQPPGAVLSSEAVLNLREHVLRRVQNLAYRNEAPSPVEMKEPMWVLGHLQLLKDQFLEIQQWQSLFFKACFR